MSPSNNYWNKEHLKYALKFYNNKITNDEYFEYHEDSSADYWYEINQLKKMGVFSLHLFKCDLRNRKRLLFDREHTGLIYEEYKEILSVGIPKISNFINSKNIKSKSVDFYFASQMAVISRIPWNWVLLEDIQDVWDTYHFKYLERKTFQEFIRLIDEKQHALHFVKGFRLVENELELKIRLELFEGKPIIEIFDIIVDAEKLYKLSKLLKSEYQFGKISTLVTDRSNYAFISKDLINKKTISLPDGFKSI